MTSPNPHMYAPPQPVQPPTSWPMHLPRARRPRAPIPYNRQAAATARRRYARAGAALLAMLVCYVGFAIAAQQIIVDIAGGQHNAWLAYLANDIPLVCIGVPVFFGIISTVPSLASRRFDLTGGQFFRYLLMAFAITYVGNLVGLTVTALLSGGTSTNPIDETIGANPWADLVFAVLIGPVVEEWVFRKQLLSRLRTYGEKVAILFSALAFALFHANLYQFFYAFGLGLLLGYLFVRTNQLKYTIAIHVLINFNGSVLSLTVLSLGSDDSSSELTSGDLVIIAYALLVLAAAISGLVLLWRNRFRFTAYLTPQQLPQEWGGHFAIANAPMIVFIVLTGLLTLLSLYG
ncbi:CPBP family intramembrane glutamic endopeptidase [Bifidobacterium choloepi]|uniref:CPBP family intramembrane metalloprotease n=1 Tax=Bifidobacterium choloepi TaxID=2614131 RepID=A0A6I5N2D0_9BIFI|nr:type II CAAX endopeptidase family protein [Bifidobacterium choloepi]NEG69799.1 CPBP family intramembrane metalloprotease [Bifidobacterium choloepi]